MDTRIESYLSGAPPSGVVILDLASEKAPQFHRTKGYFGYPFIWCMLHNYGGKRGFNGNVSHIWSQPTLDFAAYPSMVGVGLTMEAIDTNEFVYEAMLDGSWRNVVADASAPPSLSTWTATYLSARYGGSHLLSSSFEVYDAMLKEDPSGAGGGGGPWTTSLMCCWFFSSMLHRPWLSVANNTPSGMFGVWMDYNPDTVVSAAKIFQEEVRHRIDKFVPGSSALPDPLRYDAIDVARQVLENVFTDLHGALGFFTEHHPPPPWNHERAERNGHRTYDAGGEGVRGGGDGDDGFLPTSTWLPVFRRATLTLIESLEQLLQLDPNYSMGRWVAMARASSTTEGGAPEVAQLVFNAQMQKTLWGPKGGRDNIHDYAVTPWSGLVEFYVKTRWDFFWNFLAENSTPGSSLNRTAYRDDIFASVEYPFAINQSIPFFVPSANDSDPILNALRVNDTFRKLSELLWAAPPWVKRGGGNRGVEQNGEDGNEYGGNAEGEEETSGTSNNPCVWFDDGLPDHLDVLHATWHADEGVLYRQCKLLIDGGNGDRDSVEEPYPPLCVAYSPTLQALLIARNGTTRRAQSNGGRDRSRDEGEFRPATRRVRVCFVT